MQYDRYSTAVGIGYRGIVVVVVLGVLYCDRWQTQSPQSVTQERMEEGKKRERKREPVPT